MAKLVPVQSSVEILAKIRRDVREMKEDMRLLVVLVSRLERKIRRDVREIKEDMRLLVVLVSRLERISAELRQLCRYHQLLCF